MNIVQFICKLFSSSRGLPYTVIICTSPAKVISQRSRRDISRHRARSHWPVERGFYYVFPATHDHFRPAAYSTTQRYPPSRPTPRLPSSSAQLSILLRPSDSYHVVRQSYRPSSSNFHKFRRWKIIPNR